MSATKASNLSTLRCATKDEKLGWLKMHVKTSADERRKPIVTLFCSECTDAYAEQMRAEKKCIRKPGWKPRWS